MGGSGEAPCRGAGSLAQRGSLKQDTAARLVRRCMLRKSSNEVIVETLDMDVVEYASRACGAMTQWVSEVLREFFVVRELRLQRQALVAQLECLGHRAREEAIAQIQEEIRRLLEELECWRARLAELRAK